MQITIDNNCFFVFDLDDTLFPEVDYLKSAYRYIASQLAAASNSNLYSEMLLRYQKGENVFEWIINTYGSNTNINMPWLLQQYREHVPQIELPKAAKDFLQQLMLCNIPLGLITDGRSIMQRNKLKSMGIENWFSDIIISEEFGSEKPDRRNYLFFQNKHPQKRFYFFGDNTRKDFIVPLQLGWQAFCLKDTSHHIHRQQLTLLSESCHIISSFNDIELLIDNIIP